MSRQLTRKLKKAVQHRRGVERELDHAITEQIKADRNVREIRKRLILAKREEEAAHTALTEAGLDELHISPLIPERLP